MKRKIDGDAERIAKAEAERRIAKQRVEAAHEDAFAAKGKFEGDAARIAKAEAERQRLAMLERLAAEAIQKQAGARDDTTPGRVFRDCPECPEMVVVAAGHFIMGSPAGEVGRFDSGIAAAPWPAPPGPNRNDHSRLPY